MEEFIEGDRLVIRAELPGSTPDRDVDVSVDSGHPHHRGRARRKAIGKATAASSAMAVSFAKSNFRQAAHLGLCLPRTRTVLSGVLELRMPKRDARRQVLDVFTLNAPEASPAGALAAASDRPASRCRGYPRRAGVAVATAR